MPETTPEQHIARIDTLTAAGRANWFALLGYIAFAGVTLLAVQDADFFLDSRRTDLPLVGVAIPTREFFVFGPLLGTALYVYLHLYLLKLWEALAAAPASPNDEPLSVQISPWLIADFGLWLRGDGACQPRPMDWLAHIVTFLLAFLIGPLLIGAFWVRYWPAHQTWYAIGIGLLLTLTLMTMLASLFTAISRLRYHRKYQGGWWHLLAAIPSALILSVVLTLSIVRTEGPHQLGPFQPAAEAVARALGTNLTIARANLREVVFTELPDDWLPYETHKRRFRVDWCAREGLNAETCGPPPRSDIAPAPHLPAMRDAWCAGLRYGTDTAACTAYFGALDARFLRDWTFERSTRLGALDGWSPRNTDLRGADLGDAILTAADLRHALLDGANLNSAQMEGANLGSAQLNGADLTATHLEGASFLNAHLTRAYMPEARMEGANLGGASMSGADLSRAELEGAYLGYADLSDADLSGAQMEGVDLSGAHMKAADLSGGAQMEGANLSEAQMEGANFSGAQLEGADFSEAQLDKADLRGVQMNAADLSQAQMVGATLTGAQMDGVDLSWARLEGAVLTGAQMDRAVLWHTQMVEAVLWQTRMEGADLRWAQFQSAAWSGATIGASPAHAGDFRGGTALGRSGLSSLIGNAATLLPETLDNGSLPYVCSCWATDPLGVENLIALFERNGTSEADLRDPGRGWFCPGESPRKTGTPWPLATPLPDEMEGWEKDLAYWRPAMADRRAAPYCDHPAGAE
jgi:uncharacterized protein YjbI with pentapeptide repeats